MEAARKRSYARDAPTTWATRQAPYGAVREWGIPDHALLQRVSAIKMPVFVASGDSDPMILLHYSHMLAGLIPQVQMKIYPDSAHVSCSSITSSSQATWPDSWTRHSCP